MPELEVGQQVFWDQFPVGPVPKMICRARLADPEPSHLAAVASEPGALALHDAIVAAAVGWQYLTAFDLAAIVMKRHPDRWSEDSIRTAVSRLQKAGKLEVVDELGRSPRGRACTRYRLA